MASLVPEFPVLARDQAFEDLYRRYVKDVYHYALALLRNPADAEDVTQTTFMNAYRAYKRGDEILKPHNWLIKIAHNVARTRYARASRRVKEVPLEDHVEQLALPEDERPNVEGVLRALGRLPFNQRAALVMRELEGRSYVEIADTLEVSVSAVETLIFRARKALRLRASSLRVLTVVPLPGSLTQLFQGGGLVAGGGAAVGAGSGAVVGAGGGAAVGTGVLAKVAVAIIVGAFATSLGGDEAGPAEAAAQDKSSVVVTASTAGNGTMTSKPREASRNERVGTADGSVRIHPVSTGGSGDHGNGLTAATPTSSALPGAGAPSASTGTGSPADAVQETATTVVSKVEETASALPVEVPSVPPLPAVEVPSVPPLPVVEVPALPPPPKLP
jgi:RNA polymerase sigma factor (sigma-70 family)